MVAPTRNDVIRYAHNDVAPDGRNDVMVAHYAVRRNIIYEVNIIAEGNITCPQGQTSFGWPALPQVAVAPPWKSAILWNGLTETFNKGCGI